MLSSKETGLRRIEESSHHNQEVVSSGVGTKWDGDLRLQPTSG